jgi:D-glycero-D-manno-heptose 1,7-bisphosphate phosphatase
MSQPAVFLDRDGTLMDDPGYVGDPALVRVFPGVGEALRRLKGAGYRLVIITNQSGIARGKFTVEDFEAVQRRLLAELGNGVIDATYMCPDGPDGESGRRKPSPAMILEAARDLNVDLKQSWMVGDKDIDVQCGSAAGVRSILVRSGQGVAATGAGAVAVAEDLGQAADVILGRSKGR